MVSLIKLRTRIWFDCSKCFAQEVQHIEYFAGLGNVHTMMRASGYTSLRFDVLDNEKPPTRGSNYMDLTHQSGFAFLGSEVLQLGYQIFTTGTVVSVKKNICDTLRMPFFIYPFWACFPMIRPESDSDSQGSQSWLFFAALKTTLPATLA